MEDGVENPLHLPPLINQQPPPVLNEQLLNKKIAELERTINTINKVQSVYIYIYI